MFLDKRVTLVFMNSKANGWRLPRSDSKVKNLGSPTISSKKRSITLFTAKQSRITNVRTDEGWTTYAHFSQRLVESRKFFTARECSTGVKRISSPCLRLEALEMRRL